MDIEKKIIYLLLEAHQWDITCYRNLIHYLKLFYSDCRMWKQRGYLDHGKI